MTTMKSMKLTNFKEFLNVDNFNSFKLSLEQNFCNQISKKTTTNFLIVFNDVSLIL